MRFTEALNVLTWAIQGYTGCACDLRVVRMGEPTTHYVPAGTEYTISAKAAFAERSEHRGTVHVAIHYAGEVVQEWTIEVDHCTAKR